MNGHELEDLGDVTVGSGKAPPRRVFVTRCARCGQRSEVLTADVAAVRDGYAAGKLREAADRKAFAEPCAGALP